MFCAGISGKAATVHPKVVQCQDTRAFGSAATKRKWDLYSAVCLERHPVIIQPMQELELKFYNILKKIEYEQSLKCDHELRMEKEEKQKKSSSASNVEDVDVKILLQTAQEFEDNCQEELNNFKFAPTVTSMYVFFSNKIQNKLYIISINFIYIIKSTFSYIKINYV